MSHLPEGAIVVVVEGGETFVVRRAAAGTRGRHGCSVATGLVELTGEADLPRLATAGAAQASGAGANGPAEAELSRLAAIGATQPSDVGTNRPTEAPLQTPAATVGRQSSAST